MKNVLLLIHDDAGQEARFQAGLDLTRGLKGHLTCLDVVQLPVLVGDYASASGYAVLLEDSEAREAGNRARIRERLSGEDVTWDVYKSTGDIADCLEASAGLADIVVANARLQDAAGPQMASIVSSLVLRLHKPVLAMPQNWLRLDVAGNVLIAWDGSVPAMAALTGAIPLLKLAGAVHIIQVGEPASAATIEEAAVYLSRHGIEPEVKEIEGNGAQADEIVAEQARRLNAAYLVMGAYGHSRIREAIFGGVTQRMLDRAEIPLLLAH
ncbi:universal stress protein [Allosphingosinicella vermicomposti]|uniref:universal stress protein n=1 Tax=Allosphingosinicella vermicomposti TaxID=614671 RepID=UPI000D0F40C8|nr:universal stress protein [Allosphingosinicella vermicomposti]